MCRRKRPKHKTKKHSKGRKSSKSRESNKSRESSKGQENSQNLQDKIQMLHIQPKSQLTNFIPSQHLPINVDHGKRTSALLQNPQMNPMECLERAKRIAKSQAQFELGKTVRGYFNAIATRTFGYTYEVVQVNTGNKFRLKSEPDAYDKNVEDFKTLRAIIRVSLQMLRALHDLHNLGYIHRYIKPQMFAIGQGEKCKSIFMTDFDLAWKYRDEQTNMHKPPGTRRFMGSICYASMHSHLCQELSRRDDLESWLYLSLELFDRQHITWREDTIAEIVLNKKKNFTKNPDPKIFQKSAPQYRLMMEHIMALTFEEASDYQRLFALLAEAAKSLDVDFTSPYDWET